MDEQDTPPKDFSNEFLTLCNDDANHEKQIELATKVKHVQKKNIKPLPADSSFGLMRLPQVLAVMQVSRSNWLEGVKSGRYPASVRVSDRLVAWRICELKAFIDSL